jgi:tRNA (guanine-N7-)-methyltransferase
VPHNPLKRSSQQPLKLPDDWLASAFSDPSLPLHIDIGCDRGRFCLGMAECTAGENFLGIEIREKPVKAALDALAETSLTNCAFLHANANRHLSELHQPHLQGVAVTTISLNFPDPWCGFTNFRNFISPRDDLFICREP